MSRPPHSPSGHDLDETLTDRQTQILALVAAGESSATISQRLAIKQNTVKSHLNRIYTKTGSRNRVDAVRYYLDHYTTYAAGRAPPAPAPLHPSLIQLQIQEIEARIDQLKPAAVELERLKRALDVLRTVDTD